MALVLGLGIFGFLFFAFPAFRTVALVAGGLCVLAIAWVFLSDQNSTNAAKRLIPVTQLELNNLRLPKSYSFYELTGEVRNNSPHVLTGLTLVVTAFDCPNE